MSVYRNVVISSRPPPSRLHASGATTVPQTETETETENACVSERMSVRSGDRELGTSAAAGGTWPTSLVATSGSGRAAAHEGTRPRLSRTYSRGEG